MPARGRGRNDAAEMIDAIVRIAGDPEGHKNRIAEFEERERAAVEAEAAATVRLEEADKREAEIAELEIGLQAHQELVDGAEKFKKFMHEQWREIEAEGAEEGSPR